MRLTEEESAALAISPKVPAVLSMLCSGYIAHAIMSDHQKRSLPKERIVLGMSCSDVIFSFFWFLGTWPIPREAENDVYGAVGNTQTCAMQGFFTQLGIMTPMYNGFLALYCFLYVCRDWGKQRLKHTEMLGHIFTFAFGLSTAIAGIPLELYNHTYSHCFIAPLPINCTQSFESMDGTTNCIRGDNAILYRWAFFYGMIWINIFLTFACMTLVYIHIRKQEKKMEAYTSEYSENSSKRKAHSDSREFAVRGALFSCSFLVTWVPMTVSASFFTARNFFEQEGVLFLALFTMVLTPSQGIFNFLIYIWPEISRHLKERGTNRRENDKLEMNDQVKSECNTGENEEQTGEEKETITDNISPGPESINCVAD